MLSSRLLPTTLLALPALLVCATWLTAAPRDQGSIAKRTYHFEEAKKDIEYQLYVPSGYDKDEKTPLIVLLHGLGSNPRQVIRYEGIVPEAEERGYIVVAPYGYNERGWYGSRGKGKLGPFFGQPEDPDNLGELSEKDTMNVLKIVRAEFKIDANRIYLMGHSMGGGGTVYLGATYPDLWAGLAPLAPALQGSTSILKKLRHIPVSVVTGELDRLVRVDDVRRWVAAMKELKMDYRYNEIAGGNHFDTITRNPKMIAEVFDFFDAHQRAGAVAKKTDPYRVFTNKAGKTIKAKPLSVSGARVTIAREDGRSFTLPISSLSKVDQEFLRNWITRQKVPAAPLP